MMLIANDVEGNMVIAIAREMLLLIVTVIVMERKVLMVTKGGCGDVQMM